jgi:hypothetical protein
MELTEIKKIIEEKVVGIYVPEHSALGHQYRNTKTNKLVTSVTTKLQAISRPHLIPWSVKMGALWLMEGDRAQKLLNPNSTEAMIQGMQMASTDIRDNAGGIGTIAHGMAERFFNEWISFGKPPEDIRIFAPNNCNPASIASARAFQKWTEKNNIIPIVSEIIVGHDDYSAGQVDLIVYINGKLTLCDIKTSNGIDESYRYQVAAYKYMWEYMTGIKIESCKILHLSKDYDKFEIYNVKKLPQAWKTFKSICYLYDDMKLKRDTKISKDIKKLVI